MRKQKGFSLIELLIVVAIILIIAAIAIPNLMKGKVSANEASAAGAVRTLITSQILYMNQNNAYSPDIATLTGFIDSKLASGTKSGYTFSTAPVGTNNFIANGVASTPGTSGNRCFCGMVDGVVHVDGTSAAPCATAPDETACPPLPALDTN